MISSGALFPLLDNKAIILKHCKVTCKTLKSNDNEMLFINNLNPIKDGEKNEAARVKEEKVEPQVVEVNLTPKMEFSINSGNEILKEHLLDIAGLSWKFFI